MAKFGPVQYSKEITMKNFTVNYKLQSVSSKTKPIQVCLSLQTKDKTGKYLLVAKSIGRSVMPKEWDIKRGLPGDAQLATQLIKLKSELLSRLESFQDLPDDDLIGLYMQGFFKTNLKVVINRVIHGEFSEDHKLMAQVRHDELLPNGSVLQSIKEKIQNLNYKIVNSDGYAIDLDKFFSTLNYKEEETVLKNVNSEIKPTVRLDLDLENSDYPIPFWQYVIEVADKKIARDELLKEGKADYENKLASRFKEYDESISLGQMTDEISSDFLTYLRENNSDWSMNYYNNHKKLLKSVLRFAKIVDKIKLPDVQPESDIYAQSKEKVTMPYLTEEMLDVIYNMTFDRDNRHLEYTRDLFYLSSYTGGLTFGDLSQAFHVQERKVDGQVIKFIRVARQKTGINAEIPLMDKVYNILKKYDFKFQKITNQQYNRNIKDICQMAEFTDDFIRVRKNIKTKQQITIATPFYKLIASHSARRNFCTNFYYHRDMKPSLIMEFSQHKEMESFLTYVQASAKVKFDEYSRKIVISQREKENA